jgi:hypothetical protein
LEFKQRLIETYTLLFPSATGGQEPEEDFGGSFSKRWGWYQSIDLVANGDRTKYAEVVKLGIHEFLYHLEYLIDKANEEQLQMKLRQG